MKTNHSTIDIPNLLAGFTDRTSIDKADLRKYFQFQDPDLTALEFRRILRFLVKNGIIMPIGSGVYALLSSPLAAGKRKYIPSLSPIIQELNLQIQKEFPYTQYLIWETNILHDLMIHQPGTNQIIVEVDKDACESVFNRFNTQRSHKVFLEPVRVTHERYIVNAPESIILLRLITQSPKLTVTGIATAQLEKILVDIFADGEHFYTFQGQEMVNIFENAFSIYWINEKTLFRYAGRRKVTTRLKKFISTQTQIII